MIFLCFFCLIVRRPPRSTPLYSSAASYVYKRQMVRPPNSLQAFKQALEKEKINLVIRQNENGIIYGLTYIDHNTKCVFNGSDIGKEYSAKSILEKCGVSQSLNVQEKPAETEKLNQEQKNSPNMDKHQEQKQDLS